MPSFTRVGQACAVTLLVNACICGFAVAAGSADSHAHEHEHEEHGATETIVVTASPLHHDRDEMAIPIDRIDRDQLLENLGSTLGETIDHVPGITTTGFSAGASRPVIRGQDAFRTEVLEDGIGTHDVSRESPDHAVPINPLAARRIEVVRGPAALRYGGGASAGVVNTITNRVPDRLPDEPIGGEVFGGIGVGANGRDLAASLDGAHGAFAWHADGILRRANNYAIANDDDPHTQAGSRFESYAGSIGGAAIQDFGRLGFSFTRVESDYAIPESDEDVDIEMKTDRYRFEGDLFSPLPGIREVRVRGVYSDYEHREIADGLTGQIFRNEEFEGRAEIVHEEVAGFLGAIGIQGRHRELQAEGEAAEYLAPTTTHGVAIYVFEERELATDITAEAGLRVEHVGVEGQDALDLERDRDFVPVSGSLGLVARPTDALTFGFLGAVSQRAPSPSELFARGAHEATETFERGDADLDPETAYTGEVRAEIDHERGRFEVSGFVTQYDDFIYGALTGANVDESGVAPGTLKELAYRGRDAIFYGAEASGELTAYERDFGRFGIDGRFDFVRARFRSGSDRNLPRIVPIRWGAGLFFESERLDARVGFLRTEAQQDTALFESSTASFTLINASVAYRISLAEDRVPVEFTIVARNLSDVRSRNHIAFNKDDVLGPGRMIRFGLRARF
jgi:iron complex outermembrane receptor protein